MLSNFCLTARDTTASEPWGVRTRPAERDQQQQRGKKKKKTAIKRKQQKQQGGETETLTAVKWEGGKPREGGMEADGHRLGGRQQIRGRKEGGVRIIATVRKSGVFYCEIDFPYGQR